MKYVPFVFTIAGFALASAAFGQSANATLPADGSTSGSAIPAKPGSPPGKNEIPTGGMADVMENVKQLAHSNNPAGADQLVTQHGNKPANTPQSHLDAARQLLDASHSLVRDGDTQSAGALIQVALQHLHSADAGAKDAPTHANANAMMAYIQQKYLGDIPSAIASYQLALQYTPDNPALKEKLNFLQTADSIFRSRIHPSKK